MEESTTLQNGLVIPDGAVLKAMKTYLPYVVILAQAFVIQNMYRDNRNDYRERIAEQRELTAQWHDAFFQTAGLLQPASHQGHEHEPEDSGDSTLHPFARRGTEDN